MATTAASIIQLYQSSENCNVVFNVRYGSMWCSFPAHTLVISMWSPVLARQLQLNKNYCNEEIEIEDVRPSTFQAFLNYLYTQELETNEGVNFVLDVYDIAKKYNVHRLKTHCYEILESSSPNIDNVFDLLEAATLINSDCLKERCFRVLQCETDTILYSQDIQAITSHIVMTLLQLPSLWLTSEYELISWVLKWARSQVSNQENVTELREFISQFLPYLKFTALKSKQFAMLVDNYREFFEEVECFKIFMNINVPESTGLPDWYDSSRNSRSYNKPTAPVLIGDFAEELGYSVNNSESSQLNGEIVTQSVPIAGNINSSDSATTNICCERLIQTVDKAVQTEIAIDIRNEINNSSVPFNEVIQDATSLLSTDINEMQSDEIVVSDYKENTSGKTSSVPTDDRISDVQSFSTVDKNEMQKSEMIDPEIVEGTVPNNPSAQDGIIFSTNLKDMSSLIEAKDSGQNTSEKLDLESETLWESLEPTSHIQRIKKKKIKTIYLMPKEKSLPNVGVWDSELGPSFLSCNFKSLGSIIEKQHIFGI